jgi:hypothetical protein
LCVLRGSRVSRRADGVRFSGHERRRRVCSNVSKTSGEYRGIARTPVDICVRATVLRIERLSPEAARHHQLEKTGLIEFDPRSPLITLDGDIVPRPLTRSLAGAPRSPLGLGSESRGRSRNARSSRRSLACRERSNVDNAGLLSRRQSDSLRRLRPVERIFEQRTAT